MKNFLHPQNISSLEAIAVGDQQHYMNAIYTKGDIYG